MPFVTLNNCSLNANNINISGITNIGSSATAFCGTLRGSTIDGATIKTSSLTFTQTESSGSVCGNFDGPNNTISNVTVYIDGDVDFTSANNAGGILGIINADTNITNVSAVYTGNATFTATDVGGVIGSILTPAMCDKLNITYNKTTTLNGTSHAGGLYGINSIGNTFLVNYSAAFYGSNLVITSPVIGGICGLNGGTLNKVQMVCNDYTFTGATKNPISGSGGGSAIDCFSNTFSSDTSVIPNNNTTNVINQLNSVADTEWLSSLLNIRQSLDVGNNSQYLSDIFLVDSPDVSNTAKNNALTAGMTFATVPYIITTSSVIEPLLVKYQSPLPSTIRYAAQNSVDEIDITDLAAYYIYQNPAYIVPANKTIESSTAGDGSVAFDTTSVGVGSNITINDAVYNVRGVGSSLLEVTAPEPEPVPTETSNNLPIVFAILAGVILLLVLVFSYIWGWKGWMVLPAIIGLTLAVLAIVYAL